MTTADSAALDRLLLARSVKRGHFVLASGRTSTFYIDCRLTTMAAEGLVLIGQLGLTALRQAGWAPRSIGGLTMGADPVAYAIAAASVGHPPIIDAFSVRKEAKAHGTGRQVEGNFTASDPVVVVDTPVVVTSGSSMQIFEAQIRPESQVWSSRHSHSRVPGSHEEVSLAPLPVVVSPAPPVQPRAKTANARVEARATSE